MRLASSGFIGTAKNRLLPVSIPFRFFGAAAVFHLVAWAVLLLNASNLVGFSAGPSPVLGALHALTLGVLVMTAMGASLQLLPVASMAPVAGGMAVDLEVLLLPGLVLSLSAIAIYAVLLARNLIAARGMGVVVAHAWAALAALVGLALFGLLLVDWHHGLIQDSGAVVGGHMVLAVYGFMGLMVLGFGHILVPMFALGPSPPTGLARLVLVLGLLAIVGAAAALLAGLDGGLVGAGVVGLAAAAIYLWLMWRCLAARMRKRLDHAFRLIRLGWLMLPVSIAAGIAAGLNSLGDGGLVVFVLLALVGWLSSFLFGVLHRILPFLAAMHLSDRGGPTPTVADLAPSRAILLHGGCHATALLVLLLGVVLESSGIVTLGAAIGLLGGLAFAWIYIAVVRHLVTAGGPATE